MQQALIVIDVQQGFADPSWGETSNHPEAEHNVARLIAAWQNNGQPIVVVRHDSVHPDSPLRPGQAGNALLPEATVDRPALFITKTVNSAFYGTPSLAEWLDAEGIRDIVLCGIQTNQCVETTARMGGNLGYTVRVALDATRTFAMETRIPDGTVTGMTADALMLATAINLQAGGFASVVSADEAIASLA